MRRTVSRRLTHLADAALHIDELGQAGHHQYVIYIEGNIYDLHIIAVFLDVKQDSQAGAAYLSELFDVHRTGSVFPSFKK